MEHLIWITPDFPLAGVADDNLIEAQAHGTLRLFRLIKALTAAGYGHRKLALSVITTRTLSLDPNAETNPTHAAIHGLVGSLAREYAGWRVRLFDLEEEGR